MTELRLDLTALRLSVARDDARLRTNTGLEIRVLAAQLAELALAGALIDYEGRPAVISSSAVAFATVLARIGQLRDPTWDQLLWRQGINAKAVLASSVAELVDAGTWVRTAAARPFRPARYADLQGAQLRACAGRLDVVIRDGAAPAARELILVALLALRFVKAGEADWMKRPWAEELARQPDLTPSQQITLAQVFRAAKRIGVLARSGGTVMPASGGGG